MNLPKEFRDRGFTFDGTYLRICNQIVASPVNGLDVPEVVLEAGARAWREYWRNPPLPRRGESEQQYCDRVGPGIGPR